MTEVTFIVKRSRFAGRLVNRWMRSADLGCEVDLGIVIEHYTIKWKGGEAVGNIRKELAKKTLKEAFESLNYECYSIVEKLKDSQ